MRMTDALPIKIPTLDVRWRDAVKLVSEEGKART